MAMEHPNHRRSASLFGSSTFGFGTGSSSASTSATSTSGATAATKTYGKKKKPSHKSVLTQSHIDEKLWSQPEADDPIQPLASKPLVGLGVLDFESNKENDWETETTQILDKVTNPQAETAEEKPSEKAEHQQLPAEVSIKPSASTNSLSSAKGALTRMARAISTISNSSMSSKSTVGPNEKHMSMASTISTIGKGGGYTAISVTSSRRESTITSKQGDSRESLDVFDIPDIIKIDSHEPSKRTSSALSESLQVRRANSRAGKAAAGAAASSPAPTVVTTTNSATASPTTRSPKISAKKERKQGKKSKNSSPYLNDEPQTQSQLSIEITNSNKKAADLKIEAISETVHKFAVPATQPPALKTRTIDTTGSGGSANVGTEDEYVLAAPPKMPAACEMTSNHGSSPILTPTSTASLRSKDSRFNLASSPSVASFLSYKREGNDIRHKKVNKYQISGPSGLVDTSEFFDSKDNVSVTSKSRRRSGHRHGSSIFSSISSASLFSLGGGGGGGSERQRQPSVTSTMSNAPYSNNASSPAASTKSKRQALSDVRRSIFSASSLFRSKGKPSDSKPMISLPTPSDTSREKIQNKLRASNSLMSLTRSETSGSLIAVPAKQYQQNKLDSLLGLCNSSCIVDFDSYIKDVLPGLSKLAEASFSEVYVQHDALNNTSKIYKVIPFGNEELDQLPVQDIIQELTIARLLMSMDGFVDVIDAAVVRGQYPQQFIKLWDEYAEVNKSENHRPDFFSTNQLYCVMVLSNAGTDLEHFELTSWQEAESIFWQTVKCLALAEDKYKFEHRDLHWGNLVISTGKEDKDLDEMMDELDLDDDEYDYKPSDLKVTLIDYTLSRATNGDGNVVFTRLDHPDFFRGKGDYQFDIYRFMRQHVGSAPVQHHHHHHHHHHHAGHSPALTGHSPSFAAANTTNSTAGFYANSNGSLTSLQSNVREYDWSNFCPRTNVLWLHYIVDKLVNGKGLQRVVATRSGRLSIGGGSSESLRDAYKNGTSVLNDEAKALKSLESVHSILDPRKKRFGNNKKIPTSADFQSADHVWTWAQKSNLIPKYLL